PRKVALNVTFNTSVRLLPVSVAVLAARFRMHWRFDRVPLPNDTRLPHLPRASIKPIVAAVASYQAVHVKCPWFADAHRTRADERSDAPSESEYWSVNDCVTPTPPLGDTETAVTLVGPPVVFGDEVPLSSQPVLGLDAALLPASM